MEYSSGRDVVIGASRLFALRSQAQRGEPLVGYVVPTESTAQRGVGERLNSVAEAKEFENENKPDMIYTRYLYIYQEVKCSLLFAILDKNRDEALFWAYELYYSGFQKQLVQFIVKMYSDFYSDFNPKFGKFLEKQTNEWTNDLTNNQTHDCAIGTMIENMIIRPHSVRRFFEKAQNMIKDETPARLPFTNAFISKERPFYIILEKKDIEPYMNRPTGEISPNRVLKTYAQYAIRKNECSLFNMVYDTAEIPEVKRYREMWLYYASYSPIWQERLEHHNGTRNVIDKTIEFDDDSDMDAFYLAYGYEPDEQSVSVQAKSIGTGTDLGTDLGKTMTWSIFWDKYGDK